MSQQRVLKVKMLKIDKFTLRKLIVTTSLLAPQKFESGVQLMAFTVAAGACTIANWHMTL